MPLPSPRARLAQLQQRCADAVAEHTAAVDLRDETQAAVGHSAEALERAEEALVSARAVAAAETDAERDALARGEEAERTADRAREAVRGVSAQHLDELRILQQPPVAVRRTLCLVYALLHPVEAKEGAVERVRWQPELTGMLRRRDELLRTLRELPQGTGHPLLQHPEVADIIRAHVDADDVAEETRAHPGPPRRVSSMVDRAPRRRKVVPSAAAGGGGAAAAESAADQPDPADAAQGAAAQRVMHGALRRSQSMPPPHVADRVWSMPEDLSGLPTLELRQRATAAGVDAHGSRGDVLGRLRRRQTLPQPLRVVDATGGCRPAGALLRWTLSQLRYADVLRSGQQDVAAAECLRSRARERRDRLAAAEKAAAEAWRVKQETEDSLAKVLQDVRRTADAAAAARRELWALQEQLHADLFRREEQRRTQIVDNQRQERQAMRRALDLLVAEAVRAAALARQKAEEEERERRLAAERERSERERRQREERRRQEERRQEEEREARRRRAEAEEAARRAREAAVPPDGVAELSRIGGEVTERVHFPRGSAAVAPSVAVSTLPAVMRVLQSNAGVKLLIEGSAGQGETRDAEQLASRRARAVAEHLVKQGVAPARLRQAGFATDGDSGGDVTFTVIQEIRLGSSVEFSACSASLCAQTSSILNSVAAVLRSHPSLRVRIEGHTCAAPNWGCSNQELSESRAQAVATWLERNGGINAGRLFPVGLGDSLPVASPPPGRTGQPRNRRVEFHVVTRESVRALHDVASDAERCAQIARDGEATRALISTASARRGTLPVAVRRAAADVLCAAGVDWPRLRLLWVAARVRQRPGCLLRRLPGDVVRQIMRQYFMLGGGEDSVAAVSAP